MTVILFVCLYERVLGVRKSDFWPSLSSASDFEIAEESKPYLPITNPSFSIS